MLYSVQLHIIREVHRNRIAPLRRASQLNITQHNTTQAQTQTCSTNRTIIKCLTHGLCRTYTSYYIKSCSQVTDSRPIHSAVFVPLCGASHKRCTHMRTIKETRALLQKKRVASQHMKEEMREEET